MNICNNCAHHRESSTGNHWCEHPDNGIDLVRGCTLSRLCTFARSELYGPCGPTGNLFEEAPPPPPPPPPTLWERVKAHFRSLPW